MASLGRCRSVVDFDTEESLRRALLTVEDDDTTDGESVVSTIVLDDDDDPLTTSGNFDWVLRDYDAETSEVQSMRQELQRLQILKSYLLLDSDRERAFDRITDLASRIFDVPVSMISLIDVGRAWVLSNVGVDDSIREGPRRLAFCAHTILTKDKVMIVPDATQDIRFRESPYVAVEGGFRFYAGVSLVSPEGYKLGTVCIVDCKPWPQGLTDSQVTILRNLAEIVVDTMVQRRQNLRRNDTSPAELIACTSHDLLTPLSGTLLSLSLLKEDADVQRRLDTQQFDLLSTATTCSELMVRLCESSINSLREGPNASEAASEFFRDSGLSHGGDTHGDSISKGPETKMNELVRSLQVIMEPIPKRVPLVIRMDASVPPVVLCDDLKLFRSAVNLLSSAVSRTEKGFINFRIYHKQDTSDLVFECEDTGKPIPAGQYDLLYRSCSAKDGDLRLSLYSVARTIDTVGGSYGFRPRYDRDNGSNSGSIFWFCVPLKTVQGGHVASKVYASRQPIIEVAPRQPSASEPPKPASHVPVSGASCFSNLYATIGPTAARQVSIAMPMNGSNIEGQQHVTPSVPTVLPLEPIGEETPVTMSAEPSSLPPTPRMRRALVVDDSLVVRKSLGMALKKQGFDASLAVDGLEGLNLMKRTTFDVVFCDFLMPVMDGFDCVKQYRAWEVDSRPHFRHLIVGISAHADKDVAAQGRAVGMDAFRSKPIGIKMLKELLESEDVREKSKQLDEMERLAEPASQSTSSAMIIDSDSDSPSLLQGASRILEGNSFSILPSLRDDPHGSASSLKRMRSDREWRNAEPHCLIASNQPTVASNVLWATMEAQGWKVTTVPDGTKALRMLQARNWDIVLVDDDLSLLSPSIKAFREWERQNRVNSQKNLCLLTFLELPSPHDAVSVVQPPIGFDGIVQKPVQWSHLKQLLDRGANDTSMSIVVGSKGHLNPDVHMMCP